MLYPSYILLSSIGLVVAITSCATPTNQYLLDGVTATSSTNTNSAKTGDEFFLLPEKYDWEEALLRQKENTNHLIAISGKVSQFPLQHMMKFSMTEEQHVYIDMPDGRQIVGYYDAAKIKIDLKDTKKYLFIGKLNKMSGAGKGGGTHTEYYLDLKEMREQ